MWLNLEDGSRLKIDKKGVVDDKEKRVQDPPPPLNDSSKQLLSLIFSNVPF